MSIITDGLDPELLQAIRRASRFLVRIHGPEGPLINVTETELSEMFTFYSERSFRWNFEGYTFTLWDVSEPTHHKQTV